MTLVLEAIRPAKVAREISQSALLLRWPGMRCRTRSARTEGVSAPVDGKAGVAHESFLLSCMTAWITCECNLFRHHDEDGHREYKITGTTLDDDFTVLQFGDRRDIT